MDCHVRTLMVGSRLQVGGWQHDVHGTSRREESFLRRGDGWGNVQPSTFNLQPSTIGPYVNASRNATIALWRWEIAFFSASSISA